MKQYLFAPAMVLGMVGSLVLPHATLARTITQAPQYQQHVYTTISPGDVDAMELLSFLDIELQATDEVWSDANFIAMVQKYRDFKANAITIIDDAQVSVNLLLDMVSLSTQIDHEAFDVGTVDTTEEVEALRALMVQQLEDSKIDPTPFVESLLSILAPMDSTYEYDEQAPYAYGYSEPYEAVEAGRIVWLMDDSYNPLESDMTITWEQTYGPEVTWLTTDSATNVAFLMPSLANEESDYLAFEVTADNGYASDSYEVYVYWYRPFEGEVADAYREIMGREIESDDYYFWDNKWYYGMPIEHIRKHFELLKEYDAWLAEQPEPSCYMDEEGYEVCG